MGRKRRRSLLRLAWRRRPYWQGSGQDGRDPTTHYRLRTTGEHLIKYYPALDIIKRIPIKPITLEDLGFTRLPNGKIIPKPRS
ncbi:MAG: hypothetical protein ACTSUS_01820 [Candidatus Freyarchaeota archaeon]